MNRFSNPVALAGLLISTLALPPTDLAAQRVPDSRASGTGSSVAWSHDLVMTDSGVYSVWEDGRAGLTDIYFNASFDGGATWAAADVRLDNGSGAGVAGSFNPQVAADGSSVHVVWEDDRTGVRGVYFNRSLDRGVTWLASDVRLDAGVPGASYVRCAKIAAAGDRVYVVYEDGRSGGSEIWFRRSADAGTTWSSEVRLDRSPSAAAVPILAASGSTVCVAWSDDRVWMRSHVFSNRSLDGGATWLAADVPVDPVSGFTASAAFSGLGLSGTTVHAVWIQDGDLYYNSSADTGASWGTPRRMVGTGTVGAGLVGGECPSLQAPKIAVSGSSVFVVYMDFAHTLADPYFIGSDDGGVTWRGETRLNTGTVFGGSVSYEPRIVAAGTKAFVVWEDLRSGRNQIHYNRSLDGGATWLSADVRLDTGSGSSQSLWPRIAVSGEAVLVAYVGTAGGNHIRTNIPFGFLPYGTGLGGTAGQVPLLAGSGSATLGNAIQVDLTGGLEDAVGVLLVGAPTSVLFQGGTILVDPVLVVPVAVDAAGSLSMPLSVPATPSLVGDAFFFQVLLADPGAAFGISFSNGLELWIG